MSRLLRNPETRWFFVSFLLTMLSLSAVFLLQAANGPAHVTVVNRLTLTTPGTFTFSTPLQLPKPPPQPTDVFFIADGEPEIKIDVFGNIYAAAINGVPGGTDFWKSVDNGASFVYMGQPDGLQDKCNPPLSQCLALGGADDSIDVSPGGYLYISSALRVWAKKTCQLLFTGDEAGDPSQVMSTTPGLPATTQGCTAVVVSPTPLSTCTAGSQVSP